MAETQTIEKLQELLEDVYKNVTEFVIAEYIENEERKSEFVSKNEYISRKYRKLVLDKEKLNKILKEHDKVVLKKIAKGLGSYLELVIFIENKEIKEILEDISFKEAEKKIREFLNIKVAEKLEKILYLEISSYGKIENIQVAYLSNDYVNRKVIKRFNMKDGSRLYLVEAEDKSFEGIEKFFVECKFILQSVGRIMTKDELEEFLEKYKDKLYFDFLTDFDLEIKNKKVRLEELEKFAKEWYQNKISAISSLAKISETLASIFQRSLDKTYAIIKKNIESINKALQNVKNAKKIYNYRRKLKVLNNKAEEVLETTFDSYFEIIL